MTSLDKAQILYNHIWHSGLDAQYVEQLYVEKRYRKIIDHKNFNPRLISYILDSTRLDDCPAEEYWNYIVESLANPSQIWDNPFVAQQDDFGRALIFLLVLHGSSLSEIELSDAYRRYIAFEQNQHFRGRHEFQSNIRLLTGSLLNRTVASSRVTSFDLFNPSIADYVIRRYAGDSTALLLGLQSLKSVRSLITFLGLRADRHLSEERARLICEALMEYLNASNFNGASVQYVSFLCDIYRRLDIVKNVESSALKESLNYILTRGAGLATDYSFSAVQWGVERGEFSGFQALKFLTENVDVIDSFTEMKAVGVLLSNVSGEVQGYADLLSAVRARVVSVVSESFNDFIDANSAFSNVEYEDHETASRELEKLIEKELSSTGIDFDRDQISDVLSAYDVADGLRSYYENSYDDDERQADGPAVLAIDEIDDLFDRSEV